MKHKRNKPLFIHFLSSEIAQKLITPSFFLSDAPHNGRTGYVGPNRLHDNVNSYVRQPDFIVASPAAWLVSQHEPHDGTSPRWSIGEPLVRYKQLYVDILQSLHSTKYLHANRILPPSILRLNCNFCLLHLLHCCSSQGTTATQAHTIRQWLLQLQLLASIRTQTQIPGNWKRSQSGSSSGG